MIEGWEGWMGRSCRAHVLDEFEAVDHVYWSLSPRAVATGLSGRKHSYAYEGWWYPMEGAMVGFSTDCEGIIAYQIFVADMSLVSKL